MFLNRYTCLRPEPRQINAKMAEPVMVNICKGIELLKKITPFKKTGIFEKPKIIPICLKFVSFLKKRDSNK